MRSFFSFFLRGRSDLSGAALHVAVGQHAVAAERGRKTPLSPVFKFCAPALFARPPSSPARPLRPPALFGVRNPILSLETFLTQNKTKQNETKRPRIWWSAACVPALRAIASGSAGASAFSPDGGAGLAGFLPKKPINLVATFHGGPDAAVSAAESSAEAALSRVAPAPAHPLFLLRSDGVIKGAVDGKMAQKLETIYDAAASRILDEEGSSPPFIVCIMRSKNKEGMLEQIAELVAPKLGLPAPDAGKSTWVAGAVGKNWFEGDGGGGSSFVEPSDADAQFALQAGFGNVLEMPEAFGEREKETKRESERKRERELLFLFAHDKTSTYKTPLLPRPTNQPKQAPSSSRSRSRATTASSPAPSSTTVTP